MSNRFLARAAHAAVLLRPSGLRMRDITTWIESLERRLAFHAGHDHGLITPVVTPTPIDLPASLAAKLDDSGHISLSNFLKLPAREQAMLNLHQIEDDRPLEEQLAELTPLPSGGGGNAGGDADVYALPDLVPLTSGTYLKPYLDQTEQPGRNLLRFSTAVGNQGTGPAILYSGNTSDYVLPDGRQLVKQRLFSYNGTSFTQVADRDAGRFVYHAGHGHFHLEDYARYRLLTSVGGQPGEQVYRNDGTEAVGDKVGFCLININNSFTTTAGASSTTLPGYNRSGQPATSCGFLQGIHVGKADVYDSIYDGQWIDVTGVPNGNYFLEVTLDASDAMLETNETNNTVRVPVTLSASTPTGGIALDRFEAPAVGGPNNDFAHATNLGELGVQTQAGLTMHADSDADYFTITAASTGRYNIELLVADRIVDLYVYDADHTELGRNTTATSGTTGSPVTKRVTADFVEGRTYFVRAEGFSGSGTGGDTGGRSLNYALKVFINPTVRATAPLAGAGEDDLVEGGFRLARNGPFSGPLTVDFTIGGTAQRGVDYDLVYNGAVITGNSFIIGVESLGETIRVVPKTDAVIEAAETVTLTLASTAAYVIGQDSPSALVTLADTAPRGTSVGFDAMTNTLALDFTLDVSASLGRSDLQIVDLLTGEATAVTASAVSWLGEGNRAVFTLDGPLPRGSYRATLLAAGVTHELGAPLAADLSFDFNYLPADGNLSGAVDFDDLVVLSQHYGSQGTFADGDYNYDGRIDFDDLVLLAQNYNAVAVPPAGAPLSARVVAPPVTKARGRPARIAVDVL